MLTSANCLLDPVGTCQKEHLMVIVDSYKQRVFGILRKAFKALLKMNFILLLVLVVGATAGRVPITYFSLLLSLLAQHP